MDGLRSDVVFVAVPTALQACGGGFCGARRIIGKRMRKLADWCSCGEVDPSRRRIGAMDRFVRLAKYDRFLVSLRQSGRVLKIQVICNRFENKFVFL